MILIALTIIGLSAGMGGLSAYFAHRRLDKAELRIEKLEQELGI